VPEAVLAPPPAPAVGFDMSQLSEADQKVHRDAKRFAKLLISEIELYNKTKVTEGRKSGDLYKRLKSDIDRSRQTYEKRFGKTVTKQYDYFHEELVRTLAGNEASLLGSEYPGPSV
jgi:DNA replication initiation complex subunit (GINS family)